MRVVLAHAFAFGERLRCRIAHMRDTGFIRHAFQQGQHHIMQTHVGARLDRGVERIDEGLNGRVHTRQSGLS